jgi:hypothetical protein
MWWAVAAGDDATYTNRLVAYRLQVRRELHRIATPLRISPPLLTLLSGFSGVNLALGPKRVHRSDRRTLTGASLAAETDESRDEESRLKAGCSQDWLPHKRPGPEGTPNRPQVNNLPHKARGFLGSVNAAPISACATIWPDSLA